MHAAAANSPLQFSAADTSCGFAARRQPESPSQSLPLRFSSTREVLLDLPIYPGSGVRAVPLYAPKSRPCWQSQP